jgi:hypothetical protein
MVAVLGNKWAKIESLMNNRPQTHVKVKDHYRKNLLKNS